MLKSLQAGRAIAALMVVLFHLGGAIEKYFNTSAFVVPWGRSGVEFFFVLSGFIIATAHWDDIGRPERLLRFARKRLARIYPIYWVVFLLALAGGYRFVDLTAMQIFNAMVLTPTGSTPVITVAWSLQWEMVFYVIFALLIVHPALALAATLAALVCLPSSSTYLLLFFAGVACAIVDRSSWPVRGRLVAWIGAAIFTVTCAVETWQGTQPYFWYGLGAALLVLGLARAERAGHVFGAHRLVQLIGNASYSIYLVHYPFISAACKVATAIGLHGAVGAAVCYSVTLVAAVLAGVLLHLVVEQPMLARLSGTSARRNSRRTARPLA